MVSQYGTNYGYVPQQQSYSGAYANNPYGQTSYSGPNLYNYNNTGNPGYGLYGNNPNMTLAESPYARMTGQTTSLSSTAIPNLSSFQQPMTVDMNAFTGNTGGIPYYPSFIGATAMNNSQKPLYTSYSQYQDEQQQLQQQQYQQQMQQQQYAPQQQYQQFAPQQQFAQQFMPQQQCQQFMPQQQFAQQFMPQQQCQQPAQQQNNLIALLGILLTALMGASAGNQQPQAMSAQIPGFNLFS